MGVIGAGPSGLVACKTLAQFGLPYTAYEAGERVGGQWVLDNSSGSSVAYRSLRTNTAKRICRYADYPLPDHYPAFPGHEQMAEYFDSYARHFRLHAQIRFGTRVLEARPRERGGYELLLGGGERVEHDALIVAVGNLWEPEWPEFEGEFSGPLIHAKDYRDPGDPVDCRGRKVLVIGLGNTACELAVELSKSDSASRVYLSARSGQYILPKIDTAIPHPSDPLDFPFSWLPRGIRDALFRIFFPRAMGRVFARLPAPESLGLPAPPADFFEKRFVMNDHLFERLAEGGILPKPGVRSLSGNWVEFSDGSREAVDVIIAATGYRFSLPFLSDAVLGCTAEELSLFRGVMHPRRHDLFVIGVMRAICSIWPRSEQQMAFVAPLLAGQYALPSRAEIDRESYRILEVPFGNCQFHTADLRRELKRGRKRMAKKNSAGG